jgi:transposase-like protein
LDALLKECDSPEELLGENGLLSQLTKALVERALEGEMTNHLGALTTTLSDSGILSG